MRRQRDYLKSEDKAQNLMVDNYIELVNRISAVHQLIKGLNNDNILLKFW